MSLLFHFLDKGPRGKRPPEDRREPEDAKIPLTTENAEVAANGRRFQARKTLCFRIHLRVLMTCSAVKHSRSLRTVSGFLILLFFSICPGFSSPAYADIRQFIPKIYDTSAELELNMTYDSNDNKSDGRGLKTTDFFSRERLNFYLNGYVYHPRFIQYSVKLSAGLKQENYESDLVSSGWTTGTSKEYDFRAVILPEHPYNLELFALRIEPLARQAFSTQSSAVSYSTGAVFRYKQKPYFFNMSYVSNTNETSGSSYNNTSFHVSGTYYKEFRDGKLFSLSGSYNHRESSNSFSSAEATTDDVSFNNNITLRDTGLRYFPLRDIVLGSSLGYSTLDQTGGSNTFNTTVFTWAETLRASLPWNFGAGLAYAFSKSDSEFDSHLSSSDSSESTSNIFNFDLTHKLYKSLFTHYAFGYSSLSSPTGDSTRTSNALGLNYAKKIPAGRLMAGANYSIQVIDNKGALFTTNEAHNGVTFSAPPAVGPDTGLSFGDFKLDNTDVDIPTINVFIRNPLAPASFEPLSDPFNYTVVVVGRDVYIDIINLPPQPQYNTPGTFDFLVSYSLVERDVELENTNISFNVSAALFNDLLNPYYIHSRSIQKEVSGTIDGDNFDDTMDTVGININKLPFTFMLEYVKVKSNMVPYTAWKSELRYMKDISSATSIQAKVRYSSTDYSQGTSPGGEPYTDTLYGVDAGIQQRFPKRNITFSGYASYSQKTGLSTSTVYSGSSVLTWNTGKMLLSTGATASSSTSEFGGTESSRISQYYYLNFKRQLF